MTEHETTTRRRGLSRRPAITLILALTAAGCGGGAEPGTPAAAVDAAGDSAGEEPQPVETTPAAAAPAVTPECAEARTEAEALAPAALAAHDNSPGSQEWQDAYNAVRQALFEGRPVCGPEEGSAAAEVYELKRQEQAARDAARQEENDTETGDGGAFARDPDPEETDTENETGGGVTAFAGNADPEETDTENGDGETPAGTAAPADDGHNHGDNGGHDHGPVLPDDPEWVDELPEPLDPDPEPVGAVLDWDQFKLRPLAEVRPDVCEAAAWMCGAYDNTARWTWGPMQITIGTRAITPRNPDGGHTFVMDTEVGQIRVTQLAPAYDYRVTGFNPQDVNADGLRDVRILLRVTTDVPTDAVNLSTGETEHQNTGEVINGSVLALVLPEHADTVTFDSDGNMTGATLLVFYPPPPGGEGG